ncbi:MAG: 4Fe-4S binding protein [Chloroflexi bacterium]|nr:4Fe-4S binding protein [Chloroflexota bacterium]
MVETDTMDPTGTGSPPEPQAWPTATPRKRKTSFWTRKTNLPTYEVVGPLHRLDYRLLSNARSELNPGSEQYNAFYKMYPELEEYDKKLRPFVTEEQKERQKESLFGEEALALALNNACRIDHFLSREAEGPVNPRRVIMTPEKAARTIKGVARHLGADLVGIARINPAWVYTHSRVNTDGLRIGNPIPLDQPYGVVMAVAYHDFDMLLAGRGISLVGNIETDHIVFCLGAVLGVRMTSFIRNLGYNASYRGGRVQAVPLAVDAGLGEVGRAGMLNTKKYGPAIRLVTVTTDLPMAPDGPVDIGVKDLCRKCKKCAEVCPVGAITDRDEQENVRGVKLWPVDGEKCWRHRAAMGSDCACFYCLSACCWTKPQNILHWGIAEMVARSSLARTLFAWLDDVLYGHQPRQHKLPVWLRYSDEKPALKERISRFLHHV